MAGKTAAGGIWIWTCGSPSPSLRRKCRVCADPATGATETAAVFWAEGLSRWTLQFEAWAIEVLRHTRSISDGSRLLRLGWDACDQLKPAARGFRSFACYRARILFFCDIPDLKPS